MRPRRCRNEILEPEAWLTALLCRGLSIPLFGYTTVSLDWRVAPRSIDEHLVYFIVNNACEGRVGNRPFRLEPGSFSWIMPGANHELWIPRGSRPFKLYFFKLKMDGSNGRSPRLSQEQIVQGNCWALRPSIAAIVASREVKLMYHETHLRGLLAVLFSRVLRDSTTRVLGGAVLNQAQRQHLVQYVRTQTSARPTPRDLAVELHLSADYFSRAFRRTFSVSPRRWLLNERIRLAAMLLAKPGLSVSEVAYQFGYRDVYLFSRQFKQVFGLSPKFFQQHSGL
jgi:AraC family transcriptional regulator, arabinose operon regulatory protein